MHAHVSTKSHYVSSRVRSLTHSVQADGLLAAALLRLRPLLVDELDRLPRGALGRHRRVDGGHVAAVDATMAAERAARKSVKLVNKEGAKSKKRSRQEAICLD